MRDFLRHNSLSLGFIALLVGALVGQALAGQADYNAQQFAQGGGTASLGEYVTSSAYTTDVAENWQSEYLQFFLYIFLTVWLVQRGSPESKLPHKAGTESDQEQMVGPHAKEDSPKWARVGGLRGAVFARSLGLVMGLFFLLSWLAQSVAGRASYNSDQFAQYEDEVSWAGYVASGDFWNRTFQNWQSEFLAVASMVILSVYLRQRGSPESKPVGASHKATSIEG